MVCHADVLIVTATEVETQAIIDAFFNATGHEPELCAIGDRYYHSLGALGDTSFFLLQSEAGTSGLGGSLQSVSKGIDALSPNAVVLAGIAFGVGEGSQSIGDILISKQLSLYELQRVGEVKIIPRGAKPDASPMLINLLRSAQVYLDNLKCKVQFGLLLSGDKLVNNESFRQQLRTFEPEAIGGEMEGAGLYAACQDKKVDWIVVKAICDWADGNKNTRKNQRQKIAACNAARFLVDVFSRISLNLDSRERQNKPVDHEGSGQVNSPVATEDGAIGSPSGRGHVQLLLGIAGDLADLLDPNAPPHGGPKPIRPSTLTGMVDEEVITLMLQRERGKADAPFIMGMEPTYLWASVRREERALRSHTSGHKLWSIIDKNWTTARAAFAEHFWPWFMRWIETAQQQSGLPFVVASGTTHGAERVCPPRFGLMPDFLSTIVELGVRRHMRRLGITDGPETNAAIGCKPDGYWVTATVPMKWHTCDTDFSGTLTPWGPFSEISSGKSILLYPDTEGHSVQVDIAYCPADQGRLLQSLHPRLITALRDDPATEQVCVLWAEDLRYRDACIELLRNMRSVDIRAGHCDYPGCFGDSGE